MTSSLNTSIAKFLRLIFDAAFQNITLFQRLIEDRPRFDAKNTGLAGMLLEVQDEWAQAFNQGLELSGRFFFWTASARKSTN